MVTENITKIKPLEYYLKQLEKTKEVEEQTITVPYEGKDYQFTVTPELNVLHEGRKLGSLDAATGEFKRSPLGEQLATPEEISRMIPPRAGLPEFFETLELPFRAFEYFVSKPFGAVTLAPLYGKKPWEVMGLEGKPLFELPEEYEKAEWEPAIKFEPPIRFPWTPEEERKPWKIGPKGVVEFIPEIPIWAYAGTSKPALQRLIKLADKAVKKEALGKVLTATERKAITRVAEIEAQTTKIFTERAIPKVPERVTPVTPEVTIPKVAPISNMPTIEELIVANYKPNVMAKLGQKLTRAPGIIGSVSRRILPMQAAKTDAERAVIAWMGQREIAPSLAKIEMDAVYASDFPFKFAPPLYPKGKLPLKPTVEGLVENVKPIKPEYKPFIQAVAEFPDRYVLNPVQKAELDLLDRVLQEQLARELAVGVNVRPVALKEGQRYIPRFVKEIVDLESQAIKEIKRGVSTRPGIRPASFRERYYEEVLDGIIKGKKYSIDLRAAVETRLAAGNKAIADKMLADYLKSLGRLPKEAIKAELVAGKAEITGKRGALRQISELIEQVNAERKIDWFRWLGIKKWYPEQYAELRKVAKLGEKVPDSLKKFIVDEKKALRETSKGITTEYAVEMRRARRPILGAEGMINHAGLQGRLFPIDIAEPTNALIRGEITPHQALAQIGKINAVARMGQTAIDTGFVLIQGLMTLFNHPKEWGKAFVQCMKTLVNPRYTAKWNTITEHAEIRRLIATHGGASFGGTEFTEAARAGGWLEKVPGLGKGFKRFGRVFEDYIDTTRTLLVEAKLPHYTRKLGRELTDAELTDLVTSVDHMVGIASMRRLGIDGFLRDLASNVMYAPRFYLAFMSFVGRAFQGGIGGDVARQGLAKFLVGTSAFMSALALALGQEERIKPTKDKPIPVMFDPTSGEFMSVEITGTHMGLGGPYIAGFRLLGSLIKTSLDDPSDFITIDPHENPLLRYGYGRASPVISGAIDVTTGKNYLGERLDTPLDYLDEIINKSAPFWAADQLSYWLTEQNVPKPGLSKGLAEWWGLRAWMIQYREQAQRYAEGHIKDIPDNMVMPWQRDKIAGGSPLTYEDLNNEQRAWLLLSFDDYREAEEKRRGQKLEKGTDFEVADIKAREILDAAYQTDLEESAKGVVSGIVQINDYQNQAEYLRRIRSGEYQYRSTIQMFLDEERWDEVEKWVEENAKPEDKAYDKYMELRGNPPKIAGVPDWDAWEKNVEEFLSGLDNATREYIERRRDDWINNLPLNAQSVERLILDCETILDAYYEVPEGQPRLAYRDAHPDVDARLIILRGLKPRTGLGLAKNLLGQYGISLSLLTEEQAESGIKPLDFYLNQLRGR